MTDIAITSDVPDQIQIAEVRATDAAGYNWALASNGSIATATSQFGPGNSPSLAINLLPFHSGQ